MKALPMIIGGFLIFLATATAFTAALPSIFNNLNHSNVERSTSPFQNLLLSDPKCHETFLLYHPPENSSAGGLWAPNDNEAYIGSFPTGGTGTSLVYKWDASTLTPIFSSPGTTYQVRAIWGTSSTNIWTVGTGALAARHYDGTTWTTSDIGLGTAITWQDVHGTSPTDIWAVGAGSTSSDFDERVRHWDGNTWTKIAVTQTSTTLFRVQAMAPNAVVITGAAGTILEYDGTSWTDVSLPTSTSIGGIWGTSLDDYWVAVNNQAFYHRTSGGWSPAYPLGTAFDIGGFGAQRMVTGSGAKIAQYDARNNQWSVVLDHTGQTQEGAPIGHDRTWLTHHRVFVSVKGTSGGIFTNGFEYIECYDSTASNLVQPLFFTAFVVGLGTVALFIATAWRRI